MMVDGAAVAREGDKTACGASLISAQQALTYQDHGGTAQKAKKANSASMADKPERDELLSTESTEQKEYDQHFRVLNEKDGKPLVNISYKITMPSGETTEGKTDSDGCTKIVRADSPLIAKLEVPYYGHNSSSAHSNNTDCACGH